MLKQIVKLWNELIEPSIRKTIDGEVSKLCTTRSRTDLDHVDHDIIFLELPLRLVIR